MPDQQSKREHWLFYGGGAVIVILGFVFAYQFVKPAPPDHIRIATGSPGNAYHLFATRYAKALAADGITLEILATGGSIDNLLLLKQKKADIAFVQAGIANPAEYPDLRTLGSLYFEPLWVFVHQDHQTDRLNQLKGLTLSIGSEGSGTRFISEQLLAANGINTTNTTLKSLNTTTGLDALKRGEVDALFVVSGPQSPLVLDLLTTKNIVPLSFERANAYARRYDYLSSLVLPEGSIDLASNIPNRPIELVAPAATLVASTDFHPALTTLVLQAAKKEHSAQTLFAERGQFPAPDLVDFPLNEDAERFYERGTPFLQRFLPFWAANLVDRLFVMILPLITLMIPLMKILPPTYRWRVRSRIYRWYDQLRDLDSKANHATDKEHILKLLSELDHIERDVMQVTVPKSYADAQYNLRLHLRLIRERLDRQLHRCK